MYKGSNIILWQNWLIRTSCCLIICLCWMANYSFAQKSHGKLTGKITDATTNESLAGVTITAKGTNIGTTSITDGTYILSLPAGTYTIRYSYSGHKTKEITGIVIKAAESNFVDIILETVSQQLQNVVVTANVKKESQSSVYSAQKRSASVSDGISQESIRKTPDNNAGQILRRVTGVNVQDNRFVVVRGLGEQYNQTTLNGALMSSTETNRNAFAMDLIPAAVLDNITINKTATPDMPGNFAGGVVQINTKDFPASNFFSILLQVGFSDGTIGKDFYGDKRNNLEWLGFGGTVRDLPKGFPTTTSRGTIVDLNVQEQFRYLKQLKNNLGPINHGASGPNITTQLGYGKTIKFKNNTQLGIVAALNYRKTELIENEITARDPNFTVNGQPYDSLLGLAYYSENIRYRYSADLGGILNVAYKFGNNKITLKNFYSNVFNNIYTDRPNLLLTTEAFNPAPFPGNGVSLLGIGYYIEEKSLLNSILGGEHRMGKNNETKLDWNVNVTSNITKNPDLRNFVLSYDSTTKIYRSSTNPPDLTQSLVVYSRVWYQAKDLIYGGAFNATTPFNFLHNKHLLKGGILFQNRERKNTGTVLPISNLAANSIADLMAPENYYPVTGGHIPVASVALLSGSGNYNAGSNLLAAYESLENTFKDKWRIIWGIRAENYQQTVNLYKPVYYNNFQDPDFVYQKFAARTTFNFLPSVNVVFSPNHSINFRGAYSNTVIRPELRDLAEYQRYDLSSFSLTTGNSTLKSTSIQNFDLKFEWFPSAGEILSLAAFYKNLKDPIEYARSDQGNNFSAKFAINSGDAYVKGLEAELRKKLDFIKALPWLSHVTFFGNGALIRSKVSGKQINSVVLSSFSEHSLTGQPDYIINAGLNVTALDNSFEFTASFNRTGDYINELGTSDLNVHLSNGKSIPTIPHYRVKARNMLDLVLSQSFLKNKCKIKISVSNVLNQRYILYEDLNGNGKFDTPVVVTGIPDKTQNYKSGIDNTPSNITAQRTYAFAISYTF